MLFLCLRFVYLPLEIFDERYHSSIPCVVDEHRRVLIANEQAQKNGIVAGMSSTTAKALMDGKVYVRNLQQEQACLHRLSQFAYQFTPLVECYHNHALVFEIGGSLKLFGGLAALLQNIENTLKTRNHDYCYGLAHTVKAAYLLSFREQASHIPAQRLTSQQVLQQLSPMPVTLLTDFLPVAQRLQECGIKQLGQVLAMPMAELAKRFGIAFVNHLQEIIGVRVDWLSELTVAPVFCRSADCLYVINDWQQLLLPMKNLLIELVDYLTKHQLQCSTIDWHLWSPDQQHIELSICCQRVFSQWSILLELTAIKLGAAAHDMPVESIELRCTELTAVQLKTAALFEQSDNTEQDFQCLIDRLNSRFDSQHVYQLQQQDSHIPEQAYKVVPANKRLLEKQPLQSLLHDRPYWILPQPLPLRYKQGRLYWHGLLTLVQGPERIESNWWQEAVSRDYFIAMHNNKQRCWVFRNRLEQQQWYLHGLFA